jgi:toxin ParE1/3/4
LSCPHREHLATGLGVAFLGNYVVYQSNEADVVIVRLLHGARDLAAIAGKGGFCEK